MRVIEKRWVDLEAGYKKLHAFGAQLDSQWERALQVARKRKFKREYAAWKRNRVTFLILALGFVLGCSLLCGFAFYAKDLNMQCLYSVWGFILLMVGASFAFWRREYIRSIFHKPVLEPFIPPSQRLFELWWKNLESRSKIFKNTGDEGVSSFLDLLKNNLPDEYIAAPEILTSAKKITDTDVLLLGPSGIWVFEVKHWKGIIHKRNGHWWQMVSNRRIEHLQDTGEKKQGPDKQWQNQVREIRTTLKRRRPDIAWTADLIQGGIVFSNPAARFDRSTIQGNSASYGKPTSWLNRIQKGPAVQGLNTDIQLQLLEALIEYGLSIERDEINPVSAIHLAKGAYKKVLQELTAYVTQWTK